jgi:predicted metal-dependent hydrolase
MSAAKRKFDELTDVDCYGADVEVAEDELKDAHRALDNAHRSLYDAERRLKNAHRDLYDARCVLADAEAKVNVSV